MDIVPEEYIRIREIGFAELHPEPRQSHVAHELLRDVDGVHHLEVPDHLTLLVGYDLTRITLRIMEEALTELGFHLNNSLLVKMRRALIYYTEETILANLDADCCNARITREVFINRYRLLQHGCRDEREGYWRKYS